MYGEICVITNSYFSYDTNYFRRKKINGNYRKGR